MFGPFTEVAVGGPTSRLSDPYQAPRLLLLRTEGGTCPSKGPEDPRTDLCACGVLVLYRGGYHCWGLGSVCPDRDGLQMTPETFTERFSVVLVVVRFSCVGVLSVTLLFSGELRRFIVGEKITTKQVKSSLHVRRLDKFNLPVYYR